MAGLRSLANKDLKTIIESTTIGGGWAIRLTAPDGSFQNISGISGDISAVIDPGTGELVSGRQAAVTLYSKSITIGEPVGISDESKKPWLVEFQDIDAVKNWVFKVVEPQPDRTLGYVTLFLEFHE